MRTSVTSFKPQGPDRTVARPTHALVLGLPKIEGHAAIVTAVLLVATPAPGSRYPMLASCSLDETIRLWNIETGECLAVLRPNCLYEAMNITSITGLSPSEIAILKSLGAVER